MLVCLAEFIDRLCAQGNVETKLAVYQKGCGVLQQASYLANVYCVDVHWQYLQGWPSC
jgi:hypothetical protein